MVRSSERATQFTGRFQTARRVSDDSTHLPGEASVRSCFLFSRRIPERSRDRHLWRSKSLAPDRTIGVDAPRPWPRFRHGSSRVVFSGIDAYEIASANHSRTNVQESKLARIKHFHTRKSGHGSNLLERMIKIVSSYRN